MNGIDDSARLGVLSQRLTNLEAIHADQRREHSNQIAGVQAAVSSLAAKMDERFTALASTMAERNRTQWPVIWAAAGVCFTVLATFGGFFYMALKTDQQRIETFTQRLGETSVGRDEIDQRAARGLEDRQRMEKQLAEIRSDLVPRREFDARIADIQRQIDRSGPAVLR